MDDASLPRRLDDPGSQMSERSYREAVGYCREVDTFQDSDDDGVGDFRGLISRAGLPAVVTEPAPQAS
jgi:hypothetical protein